MQQRQFQALLAACRANDDGRIDTACPLGENGRRPKSAWRTESQNKVKAMKGFRLVEGKSYAWMFFVVLGSLAITGLFCHVAFGNGDYAVVVFPVFGLFILIVEQTSRVALDGRWRAAYPMGSPGYNLIMTANAFWIILALYMAYTAFR
jgi:hypothetical protein